MYCDCQVRLHPDHNWAGCGVAGAEHIGRGERGGRRRAGAGAGRVICYSPTQVW